MNVLSPTASQQHERWMRWLFAAFAAGVICLWAVAAGVDGASPDRKRLDAAEDRAMAGVVFLLGVVHAVISGAVRALAPARLGRTASEEKLAAMARGCAVVGCLLCAVPALFGLAYVLMGGDATRGGFFFVFALTCIAAHYAARLRP